jgi:hypothetical protein
MSSTAPRIFCWRSRGADALEDGLGPAHRSAALLLPAAEEQVGGDAEGLGQLGELVSAQACRLASTPCSPATA